MSALTKILDAYYRLLKLLLTLLMGGLIVPILMQVLSRHVGIIPRFIWTEEIARFCFVWVIMLGAMVAVRDGTHFDVDLLPDRIPRWLNAAITLFAHLAVFCVAITFIYYGYDFAVLGSRQQSEISGLPMLTIYIAWPIAGVTWVLFLFERIAADIRRFRTEQPA
ncbi:MAG: TRAP transporter small permease [Alphaproteobacteria bacterium]